MRKALAIALSVIVVAVSIVQPTASAGPLAGRSICIDAGHGGSRGGAVNSAYDLDEGEINLDVSRGLKALLEADGARVYMTRTRDVTVSLRYRPTLCNRARADILVSVHTNSVPNTSWDGTLGLYYKQADLFLTEVVQETMLKALRATAPDPSLFKNFGLTKRRLRVLRTASMPATLVEPLFMSNPGEAELLGTPIHGGSAAPNFDTRRGQIAQAIRDGIVRFFAEAVPTPTPTRRATRAPRSTRTPTPRPTPTLPHFDLDPILHGIEGPSTARPA